MDKKQIRADEYRRLASGASVLARASGLEHVREKHELAAARWIRLAELEERAAYAAPALIGFIPLASATLEAPWGA